MKIDGATTRMKNTAHGHGDKGLAFYTYEDTEGIGIVRDCRRETSRHPFVDTWRFRWLPDQVFKNFYDFRAAVEPLSDEAIAAEKAKWPVLGEVTILDGKGWPNKCWRHRDREATVQTSVLTSWIRGDGSIVSLCQECATDLTAESAMKVIDERRAFVASKKAQQA